MPSDYLLGVQKRHANSIAKRACARQLPLGAATTSCLKRTLEQAWAEIFLIDPLSESRFISEAFELNTQVFGGKI